MKTATHTKNLRRDLDRARNKVSPAIYRFARMCEASPAAKPAALMKAANDLYLRVGMVSALAAQLAREVKP